MRKINFIVIKLTILYAILISLIIFSAIKPEIYINASKNALLLSFNTIIPSLFPFFVFSQILIKTGFANRLKKIASFMCRPLFNVNGSGALAFIIGILSGYPAGAATCCELCEKGLITKTEAKRLLPFCNNSGPLFIIGAVGAGMLNDVKAGVFLYIVHIISAVLVGICFRFYAKNTKQNKKIKSDNFLPKQDNTNYPFGEIFSESVEHAMLTVLKICGFIIIFSCFLSAITPIVELFIKNPLLNLLLRGCLEITIGINEISLFNISHSFRLVLISILLGFGGICVFLQVLAIVPKSGIGIKTYILGKFLQAFFSGVITFLCINSGAYSVMAQVNTPPVNLCFNTGYIISFLIIFTFFALSLKKRKLF